MAAPTLGTTAGSSYDPHSDARDAPAPRCLNCEAALAGPYCAQCGQRAQPPRPTLRQVVQEAWDAFVDLDGRLLTTLRLLFTRPGALTLEVVAGRRARYLAPLRLYLLCSVAYFVGVAVLPDRTEEQHLRARAAAVSIAGAPLPKSCRAPEDGEPAVIRALRLLDCKTDRDPVSFETARRENMPRLMFVMVPLFAAIVATAARGRTFPEHLYFALHFHAFAFAAMLVAQVGAAVPLGQAGRLVRPAMLCAVAAHGLLALRRVYAGGWPLVAGRAAAVGVLYAAAFFVGMVGVMLVTAYRM